MMMMMTGVVSNSVTLMTTTINLINFIYKALKYDAKYLQVAASTRKTCNNRDTSCLSQSLSTGSAADERM